MTTLFGLPYLITRHPTFKVPVTAGGNATLFADAAVPIKSVLKLHEKFPLVIFPNSWGFPQVEYFAAMGRLASAGYVCVEYQTRGWYLATGEINTAGPHDQSDGSELITHILTNYGSKWNIDASKIAFAGLSYGAGISLLMAGTDPRVKTAVAMSGWGNLIESVYENHSPSKSTLDQLVTLADLVGKPPQELRELRSKLVEHREIPSVEAFSAPRSAESLLAAYKERDVPIFMASGYTDRYFGPQGISEFWDKLEVSNKYLILSNGGHVIAELGGVFALPNHVWKKATLWLNAVLKSDQSSGILSEPRINFQLGDSIFSPRYISGNVLPLPTTSVTSLQLTPRGDGAFGGLAGMDAPEPPAATDSSPNIFGKIFKSVISLFDGEQAAAAAAERGFKFMVATGILKEEMSPLDIFNAMGNNKAALEEGNDKKTSSVEESEQMVLSAVEAEAALGAELSDDTAPAAIDDGNTITFTKKPCLNQGLDLFRAVGVPSITNLGKTRPATTLVFLSEPISEKKVKRRLCGFPEIRNIRVTAKTVSTGAPTLAFQLYFFLYHVSPSNTKGTILSDGHFTSWSDALTAGAGPLFNLPPLKMRAVCTDIPAGNRIALGVTMFNKNFTPANEDASVTFTFDQTGEDSPMINIPFVQQ